MNVSTDATVLRAEHAELIAKRSVDGLSSGVSASLTRRIGELELSMELASPPIAYTPYSAKGSAPTLADKSVDELRQMLADAIAHREAQTTGGTKAQGTIAVKRLIAALKDRGVTVEWRPTTKSASVLSADDVQTRVIALDKLISRGDQVRPKIMRLALAQREALESLAKTMSIELPTAPQTTPPDDPAAAMDAIGASLASPETDADAVAELSVPSPRKSSRKVTA